MDYNPASPSSDSFAPDAWNPFAPNAWNSFAPDAFVPDAWNSFAPDAFAPWNSFVPGVLADANSSTIDEGQSSQNASNAQGGGTTSSDTSPNPVRPEEDWKMLPKSLTAEISPDTDEGQFRQNASNAQGRGTTRSDPMSSYVPRKRYDSEDVKMLMQGIENCIGRGRCWKEIKKIYFEGSDRQPNQLKQKWKYILKKEVQSPTKNPELKELYMRARKVYDDKKATRR